MTKISAILPLVSLDQIAPPQAGGRIFAMFTHGFGSLTAGSVTLLAGDHPAIVNNAVERLLRLDGRHNEARLRKLVPMIEREDLPGIGDLQFLLGSPFRRVCGRVLDHGSRQPHEHVSAVVSLVDECLSAWAYDSADRPKVVILEVDDFCKCAGLAHLGTLLDRLNEAASQFAVALIAIANSAGPEISTAATGRTQNFDVHTPIEILHLETAPSATIEST